MIDFKGSHFERDVILWGVRWYVPYPISYRQLEEMMEHRGVDVDHSTLNRWVVKYAPSLARTMNPLFPILFDAELSDDLQTLDDPQQVLLGRRFRPITQPRERRSVFVDADRD